MPDARINNHRIHYHVSDNIVIIRPEEACDESTTEAIAILVNSSLAKSRNLIVDLSRAEYVETPGFRWLMRQFRHLQSEGRSLVVAGLPRPVERAFKMLKLDTVIPYAVDVSEAKKILNNELQPVAS